MNNYDYQYFKGHAKKEIFDAVYAAIRLMEILPDELNFQLEKFRIKRELNENDKASLALALGILAVNGNKISLDNNKELSYEDLNSVLNINLKNLSKTSFTSEKENSKAYEHLFAGFIDKLVSKNKIKDLNDLEIFDLYTNIANYNGIVKTKLLPQLLDILAGANYKLSRAPIKKEEKKPVKERCDEEYLGDELTAQNFHGNPAYGREAELRKIMINLLDPDKSIILVGDSGVGKTAIVKQLAYLVQNKEVPRKFLDKKIVELSIPSIVSGCSLVGQVEKKLEAILDHYQDEPDTIIFIDEMHQAIGTGAGSNSNVDIAEILKKYMNNGKVQIIGATTTEEYEDVIASVAAFKRRFEKVLVKEPNKDETLDILRSIIPELIYLNDIDFNYSDDEKETILSKIVSLSGSSTQVYNDVVKNPAMAKSILSKSFAIAAFEDSEELKLEHIKEAIEGCERVYESSRDRIITALDNDLKKKQLAKQKELKEIPKVKAKLIKFPNTNA